MAKRIIAIGGVPASGKTTLLRKIIKHTAPFTSFKFGLVRGMYSKEHNLYIIGIYNNSLFSGTDKLSMAVQPHFFKFIDKIKDGTILFEGDRLFNQSLFDNYKCDINVIKVSDEVCYSRHKQRNDNQSEKFKKAKQTKIDNILKNNNCNIYFNNTEQESDNIFNEIIKKIFCK